MTCNKGHLVLPSRNDEVTNVLPKKRKADSDVSFFMNEHTFCDDPRLKNLLSNLHSMTKKDFTQTICLCKNLVGATTRVPNCPHTQCTVDEFLKMKLENQHSLLIVPYRVHEISNCIQHYIACKMRAPDVTSACFVVPKYYGRRNDYVSRMKLLKSLPMNSFCPHVLDIERRSEGMEQMDVWFDSAETVSLNSAFDKFKALRTLTRGKVDSHDAYTFLDSGASANFIDKGFAERNNLKILSTSLNVSCAGASLVVALLLL